MVEDQKMVLEMIDDHQIVVFAKSYCGFCHETKRTLESLKKPFKALDLDTVGNGPAIQNALYELTRQKTVPNIFISGKHIGGNSDLQKLVKSNQIHKLILNNKEDL